MAEDREAIHAYVTAEAHDAWQQFADDNGVSMTGLIESLGQELREELETQEAWDLRQAWVRAGRRVDAERRKRGRSRS